MKRQSLKAANALLLTIVILLLLSCNQNREEKAQNEQTNELKSDSAIIVENKQKLDSLENYYKVLRTEKAGGYFAGIDLGDYYHCLFRTEKGDTISFFASDTLMWFAIDNKNEFQKIEYNVVDLYIPEARSRTIIEELKILKQVRSIILHGKGLLKRIPTEF